MDFLLDPASAEEEEEEEEEQVLVLASSWPDNNKNIEIIYHLHLVDCRRRKLVTRPVKTPGFRA